MKLKDFLTHLLQETPDEEERAATLRISEDQEKSGDDAGVGGTDDANDQDLEHEDEEEFHVDLVNQPAAPRGPRRILSRIWSSLRPSPSKEEEIQAYIPHYRTLPILSGIAIPFAILLEIPGLTEEWYTRTVGSVTVVSKHNPALLVVGIALSLFCALLANICLIMRFLEKRIRTMTILCIVFLSIHDSINIAVLAAFGATKDDYSLVHAFWMTLCSTIVSMLTNVTLIIDLVRTKDFKRSGSGLTRRQRSLVIIIIGLFCYVALGALVNSLLLDLTFINGLYFTVVTIETIGFGDIVPNSRSSRVFIGFYATLGIVNLAFVVGYVREAVMEGLDFGYRRRLLAIQERRRAVRRRKRAENRWRHAIIWRLRERHAPVWIPADEKKENDHVSLWSKLTSGLRIAQRRIWTTVRRNTHQSHGRHGEKLNLWALPQCQLEAAAFEAGVPLDTLLPPGFYDTYDQDVCCHASGAEHHPLPAWFTLHPVYHRNDSEQAKEPLTHRRLGAMAGMLTRLGFFIYESGGSSLPGESSVQDISGIDGQTAVENSSGSLQTSATEDGDYRADVADTEKKAYYTRSSLSWAWFLVFWMGGAAIFKLTEGWTYGMSIYFCFIAFTTIGYGDLAPTTAPGRSIFVVWALVGVATMTIFISIISEVYTSRYKGILGRNSFKHVVRQYHKRTKVELNEQVQRIGSSTGVQFHQSTLEREESEVVEYTSPQTDAADDDAALASTSKSDDHVVPSLEQLPRQILTETRSIQQYMQLIGDFDEHSAEAEKFVEGTIWGLVDDVMGGRKLADVTKTDLLRDGESRQTLMMLGVERSLKELVNIAEQAIKGIRQRDQIIARFEREREQDEATSEPGR